jgi:hypothetical protein
MMLNVCGILILTPLIPVIHDHCILMVDFSPNDKTVPSGPGPPRFSGSTIPL